MNFYYKGLFYEILFKKIFYEILVNMFLKMLCTSIAFKLNILLLDRPIQEAIEVIFRGVF